MKINIRRAEPKDRNSIWQIQLRAVEETCRTPYSRQELQHWCATIRPESYQLADAGKAVLVAELDGLVVGFGQLDQKSGRVEALYVSPDCSRRGVGRKILAALEAAARNSGLRRLHLSATLNAVSFYEKAGYRWQRQTKNLLPFGMVRCLLLAKSLER